MRTVRRSPSNVPTNGPHSPKPAAKEQVFSRGGKSYQLISAKSGVALTRATYIHNPQIWEKWFDVCKDGGYDPYHVASKWQVKEVT